MEGTSVETGAALPSLVRALDHVMEEQPLHGVLRFLNGRTRHRYTAICATRAEPRLVATFDRENPRFEFGAGDPPRWLVPYCAERGESEAPGRHADAIARLRTQAGSTWGVIAHVDLRPRIFPTEELPLFHYAALRLERALVHRAEELPARRIPPSFAFDGGTPLGLQRALEKYQEAYARHYLIAERLQRARQRSAEIVANAERAQVDAAAVRRASAAARTEREEVRRAVEDCAAILRRQAAPPQHMVIAVRTMIDRQLRSVSDAQSFPLTDDLWSQALRWAIDAYYAA